MYIYIYIYIYIHIYMIYMLFKCGILISELYILIGLGLSI